MVDWNAVIWTLIIIGIVLAAAFIFFWTVTLVMFLKITHKDTEFKPDTPRFTYKRTYRK